MKQNKNKTKQNKHTNEETSNLWINLKNLKFRNSREFGFLCDCIIGICSPNVLENIFVLRTPLTIIVKQL